MYAAMWQVRREPHFFTSGGPGSGLYKSTDGGERWTRITRGLPDLVNPALLFAGSEFGLFVSIDGGESWARLTSNLPAVAVYDIAIHPRDHDVLLATHGRGVQVIDDITPLRALTPEVPARSMAVLPARPATQSIAPVMQDFPGDGEFAAPNPPDGAVITYYLKDRHIFGKLTVDVLDASGTLVKTLPAGTRQGINRVFWNMRLDPPRSAAAPALGARALAGPMVAEGRYTVRVTKGDEVATGTVDLVSDPLRPHSAADRARRHRLVMRLYAMQGELAHLGDASASVRDALRSRSKPIGDQTLSADAAALASDFDRLNGILVDRTSGLAAGDPRLRERVIDLYGSVMSYGGAPTASQAAYGVRLDAELTKAAAEFEALTGARLSALNDRLKAAGAQPVPVPPEDGIPGAR